MLQQFINREEELKVLEERFGSGKPEFLVIYGRRRAGKTELVNHFIRDRPAVYFLAEEKKYMNNLNEMKEIMADCLKNEEFRLIRFENWVQLFRSFSEKLKERTVVVIDEFPYLVRENSSIPSEFQKIWDMNLSRCKDIMLILIGSSVSMMEKLLGMKSPLFGRRTAQLEIKPMVVFAMADFLPKYKMEDLLNVYGCTDGIPLYIKQFDCSMSFSDNIKKVFFRRDSMLYNEAEMLLRQELRELANYFAILKAISFGYTKQNDIATYTDIEKSIISKYMKNLEKIRIIVKEYPVTGKKEKRKNTRYTFSDNYFRFWFRFVYPNKTFIEKSDGFSIQKNGYGTYMGTVFEKIAEEFLWKCRPFVFTRIGKWWEKDKEIDLVAINENSKEIFFFECKWGHIKSGTGRDILARLEKKSKSVEWCRGSRKEYFGLIAKKVDGKEELRKMGYIVFDLEDMAARRA